MPTITLLPSTNSRLIRSAGTSIILSPPVTLESTSTPFLPSACMLSNTTERGAGGLEDQVERPVPRGALARIGEVTVDS